MYTVAPMNAGYDGSAWIPTSAQQTRALIEQLAPQADVIAGLGLGTYVIEAVLPNDDAARLCAALATRLGPHDREDLGNREWTQPDYHLTIGYASRLGQGLRLLAEQLLVVDDASNGQAHAILTGTAPMPAHLADQADWSLFDQRHFGAGPETAIVTLAEHRAKTLPAGSPIPLPPLAETIAALLTDIAGELGYDPDGPLYWERVSSVAARLPWRHDLVATARALDTQPTGA